MSIFELTQKIIDFDLEDKEKTCILFVLRSILDFEQKRLSFYSLPQDEDIRSALDLIGNYALEKLFDYFQKPIDK